MNRSYFQAFEDRKPPEFRAMSKRQMIVWHFLAGAAIATAIWYLHWRWTQSLNENALVFSSVVAMVETLFLFGTMLFYYDIWEEGDTPRRAPPRSRKTAGLDFSDGAICVDVFVTSYDEQTDVVIPTIQAAQQLGEPDNTIVQVHMLDDGNRAEFAQLAKDMGVHYITRTNNVGFKAGNLRNALFQTDGDFVVICDADTRLFPHFLRNTMGYFREAQVAWVQTPHWFYDIPEGQDWQQWLERKIGVSVPWLARVISGLTGDRRFAQDPFLSEPNVFFDVIQRRRNRNGASFCCGAASVHRREAIFDCALKRKTKEVVALANQTPGMDISEALSCVTLEPYRFHVSEDIYTSMMLHSDAQASWRSVFHPQVEARMLSPWSIQAWATQRLKYAGGTFDIMLRDNPIFKKGMPWRIKLHYGATFWSYLSALWAPVLLLAPALSLLTGISPVKSYSMEFFRHFLPMIFLGEIAMLAACKGHAISSGRVLSIATLPIQFRALWCVLRGQKPQFPPTPKNPIAGGGFHVVWPNIVLLLLMCVAGVVGVRQTLIGAPGFSVSLLWVNLFWLGWNMLLVGRILPAAFWRPPEHVPPQPNLAVSIGGYSCR